jgi:hypothetical protein
MCNEPRLRPSGSKRWLQCPASVFLEEIVEKKLTGAEMRPAYEGTACHELLERCITDDMVPESMLGQMIVVSDESMQFDAHFPVDQDMVDACNMFLDYIRELSEDPFSSSCQFSELFMQHTELPELGGTADYVLVCGDRAFIVDLKYGRGSVVAKHRDGTPNRQLLCYASLAFNKFPLVQRVEVVIVQPRRKTKVKILATTITREESDAFMIRVTDVVEILNSMTEANVSDNAIESSECYFCKAQAICPARGSREVATDFVKLT